MKNINPKHEFRCRLRLLKDVYDSKSRTRAYALATSNKSKNVRTSDSKSSIIYHYSFNHWYLRLVFGHFGKVFFHAFIKCKSIDAKPVFFKKDFEKCISCFLFLLRYAIEEFLIFLFVATYITYNKRMSLCVHYCGKTVPSKSTKFHMKIVRHLNACNQGFGSFIFFISFHFLN